MVTQTHGSAALQGELWGARPHDWSELQEPQHRVLYEDAIARTGIGAGNAVLDVGCGAGVFCRMAADAGARLSGIDAASSLLDIARERVPEADLRVGDLQFLDYDDDSFDVVAGFNSFQFAADPVAALAEAKRVAKPGAPVFVLVWGRPEKTELVAVLGTLQPLLPPSPPDAPGPFALSYEGALEKLVSAAGLIPKEAGYVEATFEYLDEDVCVRAMLSTGPAVLASRTSGEDVVRAALADAVSPFKTSTGGYRIETEWRYALATA